MELATFVITLEPIASLNVSVFKALRLSALRDSPNAFGSTYARELRLSDDEWLARVANWDGQRGVGLMAMDEAAPCGLCGALVELEYASRAQLVSMWIAPSHRKQGVGRILVEGIIRWARARGMTELSLQVTSNNHQARAFYDRLEFVLTGKTQPYPNDPSVDEYEMLLRIS